MNNQYNAIEEAKGLAKRGWCVFPVHTIINGKCTCNRKHCNSPGKHSMIKDWINKASTNPIHIEKLFKGRLHANIGILTGSKSNLLVIDIDPRNGGHSSLEKLEGDHGKLPKTLTVETGGGGLHLYYKFNESIFRSKLNNYPGIDFQGNGKCVIAPPSRHISGGMYQWKL